MTQANRGKKPTAGQIGASSGLICRSLSAGARDAIYDRYAYFEEKADALQGWHAYLKGLLQKEFGYVDWVEFYGRRMEVVTSSEDKEKSKS